MISDKNIIRRATDVFNQFEISYEKPKSIISEGNGKLINTDNKFISDSLKLDNSIGLKKSLIQYFEYNGLSTDDRKSYKITEPVALLKLIPSSSFENSPIYIRSGLSYGLKLSEIDWYREDGQFQNSDLYKNQEITLNKLYPTDSGLTTIDKDKSDIPIREVINSKDKITFCIAQEDKSVHRVKRLFILDTPTANDVSDSQNFITSVLNPSIITDYQYHGECDFFNKMQIIHRQDGKTPYTIKAYCDGNFIVRNDGTLMPISDKTDGITNVKFIRNSDGWTLSLQTGSDFEYYQFTSIYKSQNGEVQLPLPVSCNNLTQYKNIAK